MSSKFRAGLVRSGFRGLDRCRQLAASPALWHSDCSSARVTDSADFNAALAFSASGSHPAIQGSEKQLLQNGRKEDVASSNRLQSTSSEDARECSRLQCGIDQARSSLGHELNGPSNSFVAQGRRAFGGVHHVSNLSLPASAGRDFVSMRSFHSGSSRRDFAAVNTETLVARKEDPAVSEIVETAAELMTKVDDPKELASVAANHYFILSAEKQKQYLSEGLPPAVREEFEATGCAGLLMRQRALELIARIERGRAHVVEAQQAGEGEGEAQAVEEEGRTKKHVSSSARQHVLLEGLRGSGKTFALAMAVLWARANGWLVFYVPSARSWTRGGLYYRHQDTSLWDTPLQARSILEGFLASHEKLLADLPVQVYEPLTLGEGPGTGPPKGPNTVMPESGWSLKELVGLGVSNAHAAVSVVVRLRQELARVTEVPVLIAIDEYNTWFTLSQFWEARGERGRRPIHASELRMVQAFRPMVGPGVERLASGVMVAANSESIGVGRLPQPLPGVPRRVRFEVPRYSAFEARSAMLFYKSRLKEQQQAPPNEDMKRLFLLTNGNGAEIRKLALMI